MTPTDPRHGTRRGYYAHRSVGQDACGPCRHAAATAEAARQLRLMRGQLGRIDATGTRRRIRALVCLGYNWKLLGQHIGANQEMVRRWALLDAPGTYVFRDTVDKVGVAYERLSMKLPPLETRADRIAAAKARNRARRAGWAPPLAWDHIDDPAEIPATGDDSINGTYGAPSLDEAVVVRVLSGESALAAAASPPERAEIAARWASSGRSLADLARMTGWKPERYWRASA